MVVCIIQLPCLSSEPVAFDMLKTDHFVWNDTDDVDSSRETSHSFTQISGSIRHTDLGFGSYVSFAD
ncbi:hypothetical protein TNCV_827411 [Trichonephila clavipes]|nr:hypothetical protein TNCV_827411 [Trichonephila clavipes]